MRTWGSRVILGVLAAAGISPSFASAAIDPNSGIDFVTVGAVNNPAWTGGGLDYNNRGSVGYVYNIGKFEVTTAQWAEFMNAAFDRPADDRIPHVQAPVVWGGVGATPSTPGGRRWNVPAGHEMLPAGGISWRTAAIYCNWLHNGKSTDRDAFLSGAYDVSTFAYVGPRSQFTDQVTRSSDARYWIPSLDEWMKAAHFDPNKPNADGTFGGWWLYSNSSDSPVTYGPPGEHVSTTGLGPDPDGPLAQANAGFNSNFAFPGFNPYAVPLGAYGVTTPWGLLDAAGGTAEWTEGVFQINGQPYAEARRLDGSYRNWATGGADRVNGSGATSPPSESPEYSGLRIASSIPSPGVGSLGVCVVAWSARRRR